MNRLAPCARAGDAHCDNGCLALSVLAVAQLLAQAPAPWQGTRRGGCAVQARRRR